MNMYVRGLSLLTAVSLLMGALPTRAAVGDVVIDNFVLSRCGQQEIAFSGTANVGIGQELEVIRDNTAIPALLTASSWITGLTTTSTGNHTLTARILENGSVIETVQLGFTVPACDSSDDSDSGNGNGNDSGSTTEPKKIVKPRILGSTTKCTILADKKKIDFIKNKEVPAIVSQLFQKAYGKSITHPESLYWKGRARCDKATQSKLLGAMMWHADLGVSPIVKVKK